MAYYCLHELHLLPSQLFDLPRRHRAFLVAAIERRVAEEQKRARELKTKKK